MLEPVALAAARGATTVGLTNFGGSPLAAAAGVVLTTAARELPLRSAATASRIAQLAVVDCLFVGVVQRSYDAAGGAAARHVRSGAGPPREGALASGHRHAHHRGAEPGDARLDAMAVPELLTA